MSGCTTGGVQAMLEKRAQSQRIVFGMGWEPVSFYPLRGLDSASYYGQTLIFEGLVKYDADMKVVPGLAERFEVSPDGLSYHFWLRDGLKFSDGTAIGKKDVQISIDLAHAPTSPFRSDYEAIGSLEWKGDREFVMHLSHACSPLLSRMVELRIMPYALLSLPDRGKAAMSRSPLGSGPFRLVRWESGLELVFEPNPYYWGSKPKCKQLVWRIVQDKNLLSVALWRGELDVGVVDPVSWTSLEHSLERVSKRPITLDKIRGSRTIYMGFNLNKEFLRDVRVRRAICMAIDRKALLEGLYAGLGRVPDTDVPTGSWAFNADTPHWTYDPKESEKLLKEAGFVRADAGWQDAAGKKVAFRILTVADYRDVAQAVSDNLARFMIPNEVQIVEYSTLRKRYLEKGDFDAFIWSRSAGPDPECGIVWGSDGSMNFSRFSSKQVDEALVKGRENGSHASRRPIYRKIQDILANEVPWVFLVQPDLLIAHEQNIINTKQAHQEMTGLPWDNPLFNAADWQRSTGN